MQRNGAITEVQMPVSATGDGGPITHLLVTTKAYDVRRAVGAVSHRLNGDTRLLLLVNGMGLTEELREDFPGLDIYCGTTTEGAYRIAPLHIRHRGHGADAHRQPRANRSPTLVRPVAPRYGLLCLGCQYRPGTVA